MWEYKPGTATVPWEISGAIASGSHHLMMCSKFLAFLVTYSQLGAMMR